MNWFRWYTGTATDPKFLVVARLSGQNVAAVVAVWAMLLERASDGVTQCDATKRGFVTGFDCESADVLLGLENGASDAILTALRNKGLLSGNEVTNWKKRQPKREDSSAERTRAYRERLKEKQTVTQCDAVVTQCDARREENREDNIITPVTSLRSVTVPSGDAPTPKKKAGSTIFRPPSLEEVEAYCRERGNAVDAGKWWDFYQSKGWVVGKTKMKDWKAAVRTWEREAGKAEPQCAPVRRNKAEELAAHNRAVCQEVYEMFTGMQAEQGVFDL